MSMEPTEVLFQAFKEILEEKVRELFEAGYTEEEIVEALRMMRDEGLHF